MPSSERTPAARVLMSLRRWTRHLLQAPGFNFAPGSNDDPVCDDPTLEEYNVQDRVNVRSGGSRAAREGTTTTAASRWQAPVDVHSKERCTNLSAALVLCVCSGCCRTSSTSRCSSGTSRWAMTSWCVASGIMLC